MGGGDISMNRYLLFFVLPDRGEGPPCHGGYQRVSAGMILTTPSRIPVVKWKLSTAGNMNVVYAVYDSKHPLSLTQRH